MGCRWVVLLGPLILWVWVTAVAPDSAEAGLWARKPVPDGTILRQAEQLVRDLFEAEYQAKGSLAKVALASKLLKLGDQTTDDDAARFVSWRESRDLAAEAGNVETALAAVNRIVEHFEVDGPAARLQVLTQVGRAGRGIDAQRTLARSYLMVTDQAIAGDDYKTATAAASAAQKSARKADDGNTLHKARYLSDRAKILKREYGKIKKYVATLSSNSKDAAANRALGRFRCFVKNDWPNGLNNLAQSGDKNLVMLAKRELSSPRKPEDRAELGHLWCDLAEAEGNEHRDTYLRRGVHWFERALPGLKGIGRIRINQLVEDYWRGAGWQDVLTLVDPEIHALKGKWLWTPHGLECSSGKGVVVRTPGSPRGSYELRIQFTRKTGRQGIYVEFPVGDSMVGVVMGAHRGKVGGLRYIDGKNYDSNETKVSPCPVKNGRKYLLNVRVSVAGDSARIEVDLDTQKYVRWEGKHARLSSPKYKPRQDIILLGSWTSTTVYHRMEVRMTAGSFHWVNPLKRRG